MLVKAGLTNWIFPVALVITMASAACLTALSRLTRCMSTHEESSSAEVTWSDSRSCIISVPSHLIGKFVAEHYAPIWGYSDSGTDDRFLPSVSAGVLPVPDRQIGRASCRA